MKQNRAELSFEIHLFHSLALVNRAANKWESIHAQSVNFRKLILATKFTRFRIRRIRASALCMLSMCYVCSFVCWGFVGLLGTKVGKNIQ